MTIIDTTTVSVLFALIGLAVLTAFVAVTVAVVRAHAAGSAVPAAPAPRAAVLHGRLAH